jgi:hypothetical protein
MISVPDNWNIRPPAPDKVPKTNMARNSCDMLPQYRYVMIPKIRIAPLSKSTTSHEREGCTVTRNIPELVDISIVGSVLRVCIEPALKGHISECGGSRPLVFVIEPGKSASRHVGNPDSQ